MTTTIQEAAEGLYAPVFGQHMDRYKRDLWWSERLWRVLVKKLGDPHKRKLLDYCCGPGLLMGMAKRMGWDVEGYEPSETARKHAEGLGFKVHGLWSDLPMYDAVIHTEVMEHVDCLHDALQEIRSKLHYGGYMVMSMPNDDNPMQGLFLRNDQTWVNHVHVRYLNPLSLRREVSRAGFEVLWERTSFPVEPLLRLPIPRNWAWKLSRVWPAPPFLWRMNIGRHCLLMAKKV